MKPIEELQFPEDLQYAEDHEWIDQTGDTLRIGISDFAQDQLGDIVFVELPEMGEVFEKGAEFGTVESVKAVSELYMPVSGEIIAVNTELEDAPEAVNNAPYTDGWMVDIKPADTTELEALMDQKSYLGMLKGMES